MNPHSNPSRFAWTTSNASSLHQLFQKRQDFQEVYESAHKHICIITSINNLLEITVRENFSFKLLNIYILLTF